MSEPVERLLAALHQLPDADKREFLERLDEEGWYRTLVRHMQAEWDNPRDDSYNNLQGGRFGTHTVCLCGPTR